MRKEIALRDPLEQLVWICLAGLILAVPAHAREVNMNTYHISPLGEYDRVHLIPRNGTADISCVASKEGTIIFDNTDASPKLCQNNIWGGLGGSWTMSGNALFPAATASNPDVHVLIGAEIPVFMNPKFEVLDDRLGRGEFSLFTGDLTDGSTDLRLKPLVDDSFTLSHEGDASGYFLFTSLDGEPDLVIKNDNGHLGLGTSDPLTAFHLGQRGRMLLDAYNGPGADNFASIIFEPKPRGGTQAPLTWGVEAHPDGTLNWLFEGVTAVQHTNTGRLGVGHFAEHGFTIDTTFSVIDEATPVAQSIVNTSDSNQIRDAMSIVAKSTNNVGNGFGARLSFELAEYSRTFWKYAHIQGVQDGGSKNHGALVFLTHNFNANPVERMRVNSSGQVGIGTASPTFDLHVAGSAGKPGGGSWDSLSDRRLKENILPLENPLQKLLKLKGRVYEWNDPESHNGEIGPQWGFIAQEVENVFPSWVLDRDETKYLSVRGFEALMTESIKELLGKMEKVRESRESRLNELRRLVENQEKMIAELQSERDKSPYE